MEGLLSLRALAGIGAASRLKHDLATTQTET